MTTSDNCKMITLHSDTPSEREVEIELGSMIPLGWEIKAIKKVKPGKHEPKRMVGLVFTIVPGGK